jgi:hypothetical protein
MQVGAMLDMAEQTSHRRGAAGRLVRDFTRSQSQRVFDLIRQIAREPKVDWRDEGCVRGDEALRLMIEVGPDPLEDNPKSTVYDGPEVVTAEFSDGEDDDDTGT